ncbi:MAG: TonB-dependent receptor domain-containing protein, partial [Acidobacteriota bacterium]
MNALDRPRLQGMINDLLGRIGSVRQGFAASPDLFSYLSAKSTFINDARYPEYDFYAQDTWKLRPNFTVDIGIRYEARLTPRAQSRLFRPNQLVSVGAPASTTLKWQSDNLYDSDLNNWSPSIGFAWDPWGDGKTSVRANYRLAYDRINTQVISSQIYNTIPGVTLGVVDVAPQFNGPNGTNRRIRDGVQSVVP